MATRKSISTSHSAVSCDVCGRTLLRGEHADAFIAGGSRRMVCELCVARAANEGWIREGADNALAPRGHGIRSGRSFLERLRPRRENGAPPEPELPYGQARRTRVERVTRDPADGTADELPGPDGEHRPADAAAAEHPAADAPVAAQAAGDRPAAAHATAADPHSGGARSAPPGGRREQRHVHAIPTNAELKMGRALDVFNASPHPRRVSGVSRSLGAPFATVLPSQTEGSIVTIVVAWELCWYRYEVDLADEAAGVRVIAQGAELSELIAEEQQPNAAVDDRGLLVLAE